MGAVANIELPTLLNWLPWRSSTVVQQFRSYVKAHRRMHMVAWCHGTGAARGGDERWSRGGWIIPGMVAHRVLFYVYASSLGLLVFLLDLLLDLLVFLALCRRYLQYINSAKNKNKNSSVRVSGGQGEGKEVSAVATAVLI